MAGAEQVAGPEQQAVTYPGSRVLPDIHTSTGTIAGGTQAAPTYAEVRAAYNSATTVGDKSRAIAQAYKTEIDPTLMDQPQLVLSVKAVRIPTPAVPDTTVTKP